MQAKAKLEHIKRVKEMKEKRRLDTLRKISEREKRAEDVLKERRKLQETRSHWGIGERLYDMFGRSLSSGYDYARKKSSKKVKSSEDERLYIDSGDNFQLNYFDFDNHTFFDGFQGKKRQVRSRKTCRKLTAASSYDDFDDNDDNSKHCRSASSQNGHDDSHSTDKADILNILRKNIAMKSTLSKAIDTPLAFVVEQISNLQQKVLELEKALTEKSDEIKLMERCILKFKNKCMFAAIGLTIILCSSGMYYSRNKMKLSRDSTKLVKSFPVYLKRCFKV